jgi:hypothetical protein
VPPTAKIQSIKSLRFTQYHFLKTQPLRFLDLNDFEMTIYSIDKEKSLEIPDLAKQFFDKILSSDVLTIILMSKSES